MSISPRPPLAPDAPHEPGAGAAPFRRLLATACALADAYSSAAAGPALVGSAAGAPGPLRDAAGALGHAAARAGLSPDALLACIEDAVHARRAEAARAAGRAPAPAAAGDVDAVLLLLWGGARDSYHDTRAALDAAARAAPGRRDPRAPAAAPAGAPPAASA
jgi:hypothetical protein